MSRSFSIMAMIISSLMLTACEVSKQNELLLNSSDNIVGGEEAKSHPQLKSWVVGVRGVQVEGDTYYLNICTGAFIDESLVITAAHCLDDKQKKYEIIYSENLMDLKAAKSEVEIIRVHPKYTGSNMISDLADHDIAILKIRGTKPSHIQVLDLLSENIFSNFSLLAAGYGRTTGVVDSNGAGQGSGVLRHVVIEAEAMSNETNFFEVDQRAGRGVCNGDSGGPAIIQVEGKVVIAGVAKSVFQRSSISIDEAQRQNPLKDVCKERSVYMSIPYYLPWIVEESQKILNTN